ncbi:hypothetical protein HPO96_17460 [Kribbella sandramycini]|uniref:DUF2637 domain-containing protein n=1 Tax=Kribbella sandramycini TaxID=60450 RepID=A0A7Y4NZW8_9ACTN|nr:hypothetical protein [Kribbella sandramycini]MBB6565774.1 hypothetical protein [Kribbella sandramycini]NOL42036.1 hypothetical protein [Kribbella sandramycini]
MTTNRDVAVAAPAKPSRMDQLQTQAAEASQVRALSTHPDVVALRVEKIRTQVDVLMWVGIVLGLAFTMVNVQAFAAQGAEPRSLPWFAAWLLDPMVSLVLIAVLRAEQITARYQVFDNTKWIKRTKWFAFVATYVMNTWASFVHKDVAGIVLHSVPPLLVFCAAETAPILRDRLTEAVLRAEQAAQAAISSTAVQVEEAGASPIPVEVAPAAELPAAPTATETAVRDELPAPTDKAPAKPGRSRTGARKPAKKPGKAKPGRKYTADYVADALATIESAGAPDDVTPAWARHTTGCSAGLSAKVAATVRAELAARAAGTTSQTITATRPDVVRSAA